MNTYILAGGQSLRMGCDKATYVLNGKTFIKHITEAVTPYSQGVYIISDHSIHHSMGLKCIKDRDPNKGPLGGIYTALLHNKSEYSLILSCDIPMITSKSIGWLLAQQYEKQQVLVPVVNEYKMPLVGIYHSSCLRTVEKSLKMNKLKMMELLDRLDTLSVEVPSELENDFKNINTPKDL